MKNNHSLLFHKQETEKKHYSIDYDGMSCDNNNKKTFCHNVLSGIMQF